MKEAKVIPLPKTKDTTHPQNLRPISLLPILSKPLEKHIHKHLYEHLERHGLINKYQSGFRPKHSCHTALVNLIDSWLTAINENELIGTVFLDFKKAFDLVNHDILLKKSELYFPNSATQELIKSYISNRYQYVYLNGNKSNRKLIKSGVPQGSVLGPLFFILYINDLPFHINKDTKHTLFADDASLYAMDVKLPDINNYLQDSINKVISWCKRNSMVIHPEKTKCMIITTRQKRQLEPLHLNIKIGSSTIEQVKHHKMLGFYIDSDLTWNHHIETLIKRISRSIFLLTKLKKYTAKDNLKLFFNAHIMSHINYASSLYDGCSKDTFKKLNSIHRRAIKHLHHQHGQSTDDKLKVLQILPLTKQLEYNKLIVTHNIYNGRTPTYLNNLIKKTAERYASMNLLAPTPRIDLYKTSLAYSGTELWNKLPIEIRKITSRNTFKKSLLKHLLKAAGWWNIGASFRVHNPRGK